MAPDEKLLDLLVENQCCGLSAEDAEKNATDWYLCKRCAVSCLSSSHGLRRGPAIHHGGADV
jgi:hypothetical protein